MVRCFRMTPAFFLYVETTQACLKNRLGRFAPSALPHYKHTLPRLARSSLNELQQKQHKKASLVCVRVQSPSGLALVPCALNMVDLSGQWRCWIRDVYRKMFFISYFSALYARTTRYEEAFLPKGNKWPRSLRSLDVAFVRFIPDFVLFDGFI